MSEDSANAATNCEEAEAALAQLAGPLLSFVSQPLSLADGKSAVAIQSGMEEARYRTMLELIPAITFMASFKEGLNEAYVSPQIEQILGYSQSEWLQNPIIWYERLHPDDRERWNIDFAQTVTTGEPFSAPYRFIARDGHVVWLQGEVRIVRDENGQPIFMHGVGFDITKLKEAEQQSLDYLEKLKKTNEELEQFTNASAHDLQEPLRTVISYSQIVAEDYKGKLDDNADLYLTETVNAAKRMKNLIEALLRYSRLGHEELPMERIDFRKVLEEVRQNLKITLEETSAIVTHDLLPEISANRTYMIMLFQNLIANAVHYRSKEPPRIHVSAQWSKEGYIFSVRDNGIGIDPQYHGKIFMVFQRLHSRKEYPGTGIGLAICKKIVELHGGRIWVESEPCRGSNFKFVIQKS